jgi:protein-S-isoprenylcysteine O-methyltransferase Ste14
MIVVIYVVHDASYKTCCESHRREVIAMMEPAAWVALRISPAVISERVRRGPYCIVRHPIYTGLLTAVAGTALTYGSIRGILAMPIVAFGLWLKTLTEERFMVQEVGEQYLCYKQEVRALVPFLF